MSIFDAWDARDAARRNVGENVTPIRVVTGTAHLDGLVNTVLAAREGTRNDTLNWAAGKAGGYVATGNADHDEIRTRLIAAAVTVGLGAEEARRTVDSGIRYGLDNPQTPREGADIPPIFPFTPSENTDGEPDVDDEAAQVREHLPRLDWHHVWDTDADEEEWILEPLWPARRLVALYSPPKVGKSLLMLEIAAAVATGRSVLGVSPTPRSVLYVDHENDPRADVRERLRSMGYGPGDLDNLHYLSFPNMHTLDDPRGGAQLMAAVRTYAAEAVVIDTVSRTIAGDENENDTWLRFYRSTGNLLKAAGVGLVRLDHTGKDETKGQRGGSAKSGDVDAVWRLSKVTETTYRLVCEAHRMPLSEKELTLRREAVPHLRHEVEAAGRKAAFDATVKALVDLMDALGMPRDTGREKLREAMRKTGVKGGTAAQDEAVKQRKLRFGPAPEPRGQVPFDDLPPGSEGSRGQGQP